MSSNLLNSSIIFNDINKESLNFYKKEGFCHYRFKNSNYLDVIKNCFKYSSTVNGEMAFRNSNGIPRQYIDVVKKSNEIKQLVETGFVKKICKLYLGNQLAYLTHSKISFKTKGESSEWLPHQDNGYKLQSNSYIRKGFGVFVCLEKMNSNNGQLIVWPRSHLKGTIQHSVDLQDSISGDYQVFNNAIKKYKRKPIDAEAGDIIVFSGDTFHGSGNTTNNSYRYSLIFEVETFDSSSLKLDDYGNHPFFIIGKPKFMDSLSLFFKSFMSFFWLWRVIKKNRAISGFIKKILKK